MPKPLSKTPGRPLKAEQRRETVGTERRAAAAAEAEARKLEAQKAAEAEAMAREAMEQRDAMSLEIAELRQSMEAATQREQSLSVLVRVYYRTKALKRVPCHT